MAERGNDHPASGGGIRRVQMPLLNRVLLRAYDDEVWNSVWERVFGPSTDATPAAVEV
jgi:hypothetical protein